MSKDDGQVMLVPASKLLWQREYRRRNNLLDLIGHDTDLSFTEERVFVDAKAPRVIANLHDVALQSASEIHVPRAAAPCMRLPTPPSPMPWAGPVCVELEPLLDESERIAFPGSPIEASPIPV